MPRLDEIVGAKPTETGERTSFEDTLAKENLIENVEVLEAAERATRGLRPGETQWSCPGCGLTWVGPHGSHPHRAFQMHQKRHAHARGMRALSGN